MYGCEAQGALVHGRGMVSRRITALAAMMFVSACASTVNAPPQTQLVSSSGKDLRLESGIQALRDGKTADAIQFFNRALAVSPENTNIHLLAGLAYHLHGAKGDPATTELAEVGYSVAARLDPSNALAQLQLGRLNLEKKNYQQAQAAFARSLDLEPDNGDAAFGLAISSYYTGDIETALGAIQRAEQIKPSDHPLVVRAGAMIRSAAGQVDEARLIHAKLSRSEGDQNGYNFIDRRIKQWAQVHQDAAKRAVSQPVMMIAQAATGPSTAAASDTSAAVAQGPPRVLSKHWADCNQGSTSGGGGDGGGGSSRFGQGQNIEISLLPALPSPCTGVPLPRMLQIDATYIRTDETSLENHGVNLLEGLAVVYSATKTWAAGTQPQMLSRSIGLPQGGITYALNIANANDLRADVLSRPTLLALDREPAQFFSGTNLSIAIPSQLGNGNLVEKPIGISMSVTPTFVDDDTILMTLSVARSSVEVGQPGSFTQALQTTRNMVKSTAILKFDQTLIVSGLVENENQKAKSGVPVLQHAPGLQYLFSTNAQQQYRKAVIVTITPRRVALGGPGDMNATKGRAEDDTVAEVRKRLQAEFSPRPNSLTIMKEQNNNRYIQLFRAGDLADIEWKSANELEHFLKGVRNLLYY
jgi:tetratricopeptide (TPR) repeat protein